jgi:hypothetical protein
MVRWIALTGREETLAQVCFPELETVRKGVNFSMLDFR